MPPDPPTLFTLTHTQWPYQSEIAGAGPADSLGEESGKIPIRLWECDLTPSSLSESGPCDYLYSIVIYNGPFC